jgi:hypothetical protein
MWPKGAAEELFREFYREEAPAGRSKEPVNHVFFYSRRNEVVKVQVTFYTEVTCRIPCWVPWRCECHSSLLFGPFHRAAIFHGKQSSCHVSTHRVYIPITITFVTLEAYAGSSCHSEIQFSNRYVRGAGVCLFLSINVRWSRPYRRDGKNAFFRK